MAELARAPASESFVRALAGETEGNPFFIEEVVRHVRDTAGALSEEVTLEEAGVPDGVREVTSRRLRRLTEPTRAVLLVASVIGREFDYDVLATVVSQGDDELVEALEEGVEARVLREIGHVGRYGFTHALVRATLYDSISQLRRARLHGRVGETLVSLRGGDLDPHLAMLAHHFAQAAPVERPDRAIDFALAAARRADRLLAWEEAAQHYRAALKARELSGAVDDHVRGELLLALGASEERAGMEAEARESFSAAIRTARELGDPVLLTRGALGLAGPWSALSRSDPGAGRAARRGADRALRGRLAAARAAARPARRWSSTTRASRSCGCRCRTRRCGSRAGSATRGRSPPAWTRATTRCGGPRTPRSGSRWPPSCAAWPRRPATPSSSCRAPRWTIIDLMELGDIDGVDIQIAAVSKLADALHRPIWLWWAGLFRATRALLDGRFDDAERLAQETLRDRPARPGRERPALLRAVHVLDPPRAGPPGRGRGRGAQLHRALPGDPGVALRAGAAADRAGAPGRGARGVRSGRGAAASRTSRATRTGSCAITLMAEVCGALGDAARAAELYAMLEPYAGRNVVVGRNATFNGSASWLLGLLAAAQGRYELAESHYAAAQEMHAAMGARPFEARTKVAWAEMLLARGGRRTRARRSCSPTRSWSRTRWGWSCWPSARAAGACVGWSAPVRLGLAT